MYYLGKTSADKFLMSTLPVLVSLADSHLAVCPGILNPRGKDRALFGLGSQSACAIVVYTNP